MTGSRHDCDWLVIGSGFGGSVSALRLAEKGYRVKILECGRRFADEDFAKTTWEAARHAGVRRLRAQDTGDQPLLDREEPDGAVATFLTAWGDRSPIASPPGRFPLGALA